MTIYLGVKKFKREQGVRPDGSYNPKKSALSGKRLRQLKAEAWIEYTRRQALAQKQERKRIKDALRPQKKS